MCRVREWQRACITSLSPQEKSDGQNCHLHFPDEENKAQRGTVTSPRSHSIKGQSKILKPGLLGSYSTLMMSFGGNGALIKSYYKTN